MTHILFLGTPCFIFVFVSFAHGMNLSIHNPLPSNKGSSESSQKPWPLEAWRWSEWTFVGGVGPEIWWGISISSSKNNNCNQKKNNKNIITTIIYSKTVNCIYIYLYMIYICIQSSHHQNTPTSLHSLTFSQQWTF